MRKVSGATVAMILAIALYFTLFWGFDALAMLRAAVQQDPWFDGPAWAGADQRPALSRNIP